MIVECNFCDSIYVENNVENQGACRFCNSGISLEEVAQNYAVPFCIGAFDL